ncbi:MAG TPA: hypothetical protein VEP90_25130, partial [Methylomirabilota bacterium]|nr:hypothetical protein [Methylomirabilota bacterium]
MLCRLYQYTSHHTIPSLFLSPRDTATAVPIHKDGFVGNERTSWPGNFDTDTSVQRVGVLPTRRVGESLTFLSHLIDKG